MEIKYTDRRQRRQAEKKVNAFVENLPAYTSLQLDVVVINSYFSSNGSEVLNLSTPEGGIKAYFSTNFLN